MRKEFKNKLCMNNIKMSGSRSIAAARARRSGESQPPVSGLRPGQSIASQAAFAQQSQYQQQPNNVRVARAPIQQQQVQQQPVKNANGLPFTKLTVSDAVGLITLRLGRVEQFMIDLENGQHTINSDSSSSIPENSKLIDNSVLTTMINRLDSLEKRENSTNVVDQMTRLEKELKESRELLTSFMLKFDLFVKDTNDKFNDFETAITDIEKNINTNDNIVEEEVSSEDVLSTNIESESTNIMSVDLKNMIKEEFATSNN